MKGSVGKYLDGMIEVNPFYVTSEYACRELTGHICRVCRDENIKITVTVKIHDRYLTG